MISSQAILNKPATSAPSGFTSVRSGLLQRKCGCDGKTVTDGSCEECRKKKLQRKTKNSEPGTQSELSVPPIVHEVLRSTGQPLDSETRALMEPRFGHDFSNVRVHADSKAAESARAVNAHAFTVGNAMVFADGHFSPATTKGRKLLAHELTHVVQQSGSQSQTMDRSSVFGIVDDAVAEREANASAAAVTDGRCYTPQTSTSNKTKALAREKDPDREWQAACVRRLGGCASSRPGGVPTLEELRDYNAECRKQTGYRDDVTPTDEECWTAKEHSNAVLSYELSDAPISSDPKVRVARWLTNHLSEIAAAEEQFGIDRRAIAGAIAWEAIENVRSAWTPSSVGPGKVHVYKDLDKIYKHPIENWFNKDTVAKQVEDAGYVPKQSFDDRKKLLATAEGSIKYIAAIMRAEVDEAAKAGYYLNCDPPMLTTFYNAWDLPGLKMFFASKKAPSSLTPNDKMGGWVKENMTFLEDSVGKPSRNVCSVATPTGMATGRPEATPVQVKPPIPRQQLASGSMGEAREQDKRSKIVSTAFSLIEEHYLMGAAGQIPNQGGGTNDRLVLLNSENHTASIDVDYGKPKGVKTHVCGGRFNKAQSLPEADPRNPDHHAEAQKYKWKRTSDGQEVLGEACEGKRHFDCGGFVSFCYRAACSEVKYPGPADGFFSMGWREVDKANAQGGDIAYRTGHVGICVSGSEVVSALGKKWGVHKEAIGNYSRFGCLPCLADLAKETVSAPSTPH